MRGLHCEEGREGSKSFGKIVGRKLVSVMFLRNTCIYLRQSPRRLTRNSPEDSAVVDWDCHGPESRVFVPA